ncbi:hypothetical protein CHS0354_033912, partial [Potamilus streckersoni]
NGVDNDIIERAYTDRRIEIDADKLSSISADMSELQIIRKRFFPTLDEAEEKPARAPMVCPSVMTEPISKICGRDCRALSRTNSGHMYILTTDDDAKMYPEAFILEDMEATSVAKAQIVMLSRKSLFGRRRTVSYHVHLLREYMRVALLATLVKDEHGVEINFPPRSGYGDAGIKMGVKLMKEQRDDIRNLCSEFHDVRKRADQRS